MGKVVEFLAENANGAVVGIKRTEEDNAASQKLSEVIRSLRLNTEENDRLIFSILAQIGCVERSAFLQGFNFGVLTITKATSLTKPPEADEELASQDPQQGP